MVEYAKTSDKKLAIQGFDCQPKQEYLIKRMAEIIQPLDSVFAKSVKFEFDGFNKLYQYEYDKDSIAFYKQRDDFFEFVTEYDNLISEKEQVLLNLGTSKNEISIIKKSNEIFRNTYSDINYGDLMGWPNSANIRDKSLFETVKWYKENNPNSKIIIWAQNSHIENKAMPNYNVNWMGHSLKSTYAEKYYSIGTFVYSGRSLTYIGTFDFEHKDSTFLAFHLNKFEKNEFILDLRNYEKSDFTSQVLLGIDTNGNTSNFVAKDRFDGLLFIKHSDIPKLIKK